MEAIGERMAEDYLKKLIIARLKTIPPNVSFSVGSYGDYTRDELIREVMSGSPVGREFTELELRLIRETPLLIGRLLAKEASSH